MLIALAPAQEPRSIDKIAEIDCHIACANSGLTADSRTLIDHGRVEAQVWGWRVVGGELGCWRARGEGARYVDKPQAL